MPSEAAWTTGLGRRPPDLDQHINDVTQIASVYMITE